MKKSHIKSWVKANWPALKVGTLTSSSTTPVTIGLADALKLIPENTTIANLSLSALGLFAVYFALGFLWRSKQDDELPPLEGRIDAVFGASDPTIAQVNALAKKTFGENSINQSRIIKMYKAEPSTLLSLYSDGIFVGYVDYFFLSTDIVADVMNGILSEEDLSDQNTLNIQQWTEQDGLKGIYVAGVAFKEDNDFRRALLLRRAIFEILKKLADVLRHPNDVFAIGTAFSKSGKAVLTKLGFQETNFSNSQGKVMVRRLSIDDLNRLVNAYS